MNFIGRWIRKSITQNEKIPQPLIFRFQHPVKFVSLEGNGDVENQCLILGRKNISPIGFLWLKKGVVPLSRSILLSENFEPRNSSISTVLKIIKFSQFHSTTRNLTTRDVIISRCNINNEDKPYYITRKFFANEKLRGISAFHCLRISIRVQVFPTSHIVGHWPNYTIQKFCFWIRSFIQTDGSL